MRAFRLVPVNVPVISFNPFVRSRLSTAMSVLVRWNLIRFVDLPSNSKVPLKGYDVLPCRSEPE